MQPTELRTFTLGVLGTPNAAVRICPALNVRQRVVIIQTGGFPSLPFVSQNAAELDNSGTVTPGNGFLIPATATIGIPVVLSLAPRQKLVAAASVAGARICVARSAEIPGLMQPDVDFGETIFRTFTLPLLGAAAAIRVVPATNVPKRVIALQTAGVLGISAFLSTTAAELDSSPSPTPGNAFEIQGAGNRPTIVFVVAPRQALYAVGTAGAGLTLSVSDILPGPRGPTGIPGPDGQE